MRNTIYNLTKRLTALACNTKALADNIRTGKRSPLEGIDQAQLFGSLGNIVDSEILKIQQFVVALEEELIVLNDELTKYEKKVVSLEKEIDTLSIEGYLWK